MRTGELPRIIYRVQAPGIRTALHNFVNTQPSDRPDSRTVHTSQARAIPEPGNTASTASPPQRCCNTCLASVIYRPVRGIRSPAYLQDLARSRPRQFGCCVTMYRTPGRSPSSPYTLTLYWVYAHRYQPISIPHLQSPRGIARILVGQLNKRAN